MNYDLRSAMPRKNQLNAHSGMNDQICDNLCYFCINTSCNNSSIKFFLDFSPSISRKSCG